MIAEVFAETFRQSIVTHAFRHGRTICRLENGCLFASGLLPVYTKFCERDAEIQVSFGRSDWLDEPPQVIASVAWLQPRGSDDWKLCADWHRYPNGKLCWTRPDYWRRMIAEDPSNVERMAASFVKDVTVLLGYHLFADCLGIREWQPQWPFFPHGSYKVGWR